MALTPDFSNRIVHSDASITDVVAFHLALRDIEDDAKGIRYPAIHTYKQVDLGAGAFFPAVKFVNGWTLQFPAGNFEVRGGNVDAVVNPVAGAFVKMTQSAAYAVTSIGAGGATPADVADAVWAKGLEAGYSADELLRIALAALAGTSTKAGNTVTFKGLDGVTDRIVGSYDAQNNRTGAVLNGG